MVTVEHLERNLDKLLNTNNQKEELFKFLDKNKEKLDLIKKGALANELGISRPTLNAWLNDYHNQK